MRTYLTVAVFLYTLPLEAQTSHFEKGKSHYDEKEYRQALYFFNRSMKDSASALTYKLRGNCFFELNILDSAESDYMNVLRLSNDYPEVYYNLGNLFTVKNDPGKAEQYLRKYVQLDPNDGYGLYMLSTLLDRSGNDSSFWYLKKAYASDSLNEGFYNTLAWEFFSRQDFEPARKMAKAARQKFPMTNELLPLEAYSAFTLGDFAEAAQLSDSVLRRRSDQFEFYLLRGKAQILANTARDKYLQTGFTFRLTENIYDFAELDKWVTDTSHPYFYQNLMTKFRTDVGRMSLPEFFMLYYGYTTDKKYSPYGRDANDVLKAITDDTTPQEAITLYRAALDADPFHLATYERLASAEFEAKDMKQFELTTKRYLGLMEALLATGNGNSADSAYIVIAPSHEYHVLGYLGLQSTMQSLQHANGHHFDVLKAVDENDERQDVYFNIDKPWQSLSASFGNSESSSRKKKAKKKKKD